MPVDLSDMILRISLAFFSGAILGLERETRGRPAGLRTIVLVCVASTLAAILSDNYYRSSFSGAYQSDNWHPDPARLAAGILTGIGFLGAGVIIHQRNWVRGVTTASQIWFVTILGLCYGSGELVLGLLGFVVSIITVYFLRKMEAMMKRDSFAFLTVKADSNRTTSSQIADFIHGLDVHVKSTELRRDLHENSSTMIFSLRYRRTEENGMLEKVVNKVSTLPGIISVHWK